MKTSLLSRLSDNHPWQEEDDDYHWGFNTFDVLLAELKMLLTSRVRTTGLEDIFLINQSVMNYGLNESLSNIHEIDSRLGVMELRLKNVIARFEPRLTDVSVNSDINSSGVVVFKLQAYYASSAFSLEMKWNDCTGRFYFNE